MEYNQFINLFKRFYLNFFFLRKNISHYKNLSKFGDHYGGWVVPFDIINESSIIYDFGIGENITFDVELNKAFRVQIYGFDPTPKSKKFIEQNYQDFTSFHFNNFGIWKNDEIKKFYLPSNSTYISHSLENIHKSTEFIETEFKKMSTIMKLLNHKYIDLLKLDIEGAEEQVIRNIIEEDITIKILCLEIHLENGLKNIKGLIQLLKKNNFYLISIDKLNLTFIKK